MNKSIITLGTLFCVLLMVSTSTAVPHIQSNLIMDKIDEFDQIIIELENRITDLNNFISQKIKDINSLGLIDSLINLLIKIIEFILKIGEFISSILNIGGRILLFINQLIYIIDTIINIINWILDLFNPENILS